MAGSGSDPESLHSTGNKVKEPKEKKKKQDKIADVSDHVETQPEIVKGVRTKKKVVESGSPVESMPPPSNLEGKEKEKRKRDREDERPPSSDKKKKKRKKEKASCAIFDPASTVLATEPSPLEAANTSEVTGTTVATSEVKEKKKQKLSTGASNPPPSFATEPTPITGAADKSEKQRERGLAKHDTANTGADTGLSSESKSKSKKRKKGEAADTQDHSTVTTEDSSRKRKKSKKSIHPNPSDDPNLTEQSRKALTYIYSQSISPEIWKFSKARQNWIIRNVWTSKVPEKYVPMVIDYLAKVQGRVRETLIESCKKVISDSNVDPPAPRARTDKGMLEDPNPLAPNTIESKRTSRACTLLRALTEKP